MSSIFDYPLRVFTAKLRNRFHQLPSSSSSAAAAQDESQDETPHYYQHGIPGIPTDGKVVLLQNSKTGSQVYLVGTCHVSKESAELVKKVIDYVRPGVVAVELCKGRAEKFMNQKPEDDTMYTLFCKSMRAPGGLCFKIDTFIGNCWLRRMHANGMFQGLEFKVAMEESSRVGARCVYMDQDMDAIHQKISKLSPFDLLRKAFDTLLSPTAFKDEDFTRSSVRKMISIEKKHHPKTSKVMIEDRDKILFANLRSLQGEVVAVVGMAHMDGIEVLWKLAEECRVCPNCLGCLQAILFQIGFIWNFLNVMYYKAWVY
ncbi:hypothetical protein MKW94_004829 [Papaver nudicaule]|uniref:TraB family protein n=1 Tax=Papaver nudicaule TaxID=74823 RepID=A0AA41SKM9_PAPNU|nr:hypothetical protein [Papaver nudicaule]